MTVRAERFIIVIIYYPLGILTPSFDQADYYYYYFILGIIGIQLKKIPWTPEKVLICVTQNFIALS